MQPLSECELSLTPATSGAGHQAPRSRLVLAGNPTMALVEGTILEAAFQWQGLYLLFTTDDIPMEDTLRITLLDAQGRVLDQAAIGAMYATGSFALLPPQAENRVRFRFIGDTDWSVEVLPAAQLRPPFFSEPRGVSRPLGFSRHFIVHGYPQPQPD